jgi:hypothetical protein
MAGLEPTIGHFLTVEDDDAAEGEVKEEGGPVAGVDHGQDDGGDEDQHLDQKRPNDPAGQGAPGSENDRLIYIFIFLPFYIIYISFSDLRFIPSEHFDFVMMRKD